MWTCPSCRRETSTTYCPTCGERERNPRDLTMRGLLDQAFEAFTSIDGRLLRSVRCLDAYMLLLFSIGMALPALGMLFGLERSASGALDAVLSISLLLLCGGYLYVAIGVIYGGGRTPRVVKSAALTIGVAAIVLGYRFALLFITL